MDPSLIFLRQLWKIDLPVRPLYICTTVFSDVTIFLLTPTVTVLGMPAVSEHEDHQDPDDQEADHRYHYRTTEGARHLCHSYSQGFGRIWWDPLLCYSWGAITQFRLFKDEHKSAVEILSSDREVSKWEESWADFVVPQCPGLVVPRNTQLCLCSFLTARRKLSAVVVPGGKENLRIGVCPADTDTSCSSLSFMTKFSTSKALTPSVM